MRKIFLFTLTLLLVLTGNSFAQTRTITGTVTDASDGSPLPGVTVIVSGRTGIGTVTDMNGRYSLNVPEGSQALEFSFVGMQSRTMPLGTANVINVAMEMSTEFIEELVVTALGLTREARTVGYAAQRMGEAELSGSREVNVSHMLKGRMAGVQVGQTAGGVGGSSSVTIRGFSSISGDNQPLYVVDGVPITNLGHSSGGLWGEVDYGDGIGSLNSEDIANVTVLKGPNASALYGSRGSNGVILITTKSGGARQGLGVEFNTNTSVDIINMVPTFQNEYGTGYEGTNLYGAMREIPAGSGNFYETMDAWHGDHWGPPLDGRRIIVNPWRMPGEELSTIPLTAQPADNIRNFFDNGLTTTNTLAFTGGGETSNARLSLSNMSARGIMPGHQIGRQTVNLRTFTRASDLLSFDAQINYIHETGEQRPGMGMGIDHNVVRDLHTFGRYVPLDFLKRYYEETGTYGAWPGVLYNPYYQLGEIKNNDSRDRIIGRLSTNLQFNNWLSLLGRIGTDFYSEDRLRTYPVGARGADQNRGRLIESDRNVKDLNADLILNAGGELSPIFSANGSVGLSYLNQTRDYVTVEGRNFYAPGVYHISNVADVRPSRFFSEKEMQSVFFTGQLGYRNFLFLDVTGRNDWSSALGRDNYSFFYPSVSGSLIFTDAFDFIPRNILPFGKIRASWAQVGNDSDPYLTRAGFTVQTVTYAGQPRASGYSRIPLFDLKNELTESWEVGLDLRFIENRIGLDITYYDAKTSNQIIPVSISNASGFSTVVINAGEIANSGLEATLNLVPVRINGGLNWDINANFAANRSQVVELAPGVETYTLTDGVAGGTVEARPGEPFGSIIGYAYKRAPDGQKIVTPGGAYARESTLSILGNIMPDWIAGVNNTLSYRGFSANVLVDMVMGKDMYSSTKYQMTAKGTGQWTTWGRRPQDTDDEGNQLPYVGVLPGVVEVFDEVTGELTGYAPNERAVDGQTLWASRAWSGIAEEFVVDASYIMLREVMLSYRVNPSLLRNLRIEGLTLSLVGRNLWYIKEHMQGMGVSPETAPNTSAGYSGIDAHSLPTTRTFGLNVKVNF
jgi:TonB-linked SusC/RagA family outer membrane protein